MTDLLTKAFKIASELPDDTQDSIAKQILDEIEYEMKWERSFEASKDKLNSLAEKAIRQSKENKTIKTGFDEI